MPPPSIPDWIFPGAVIVQDRSPHEVRVIGSLQLLDNLSQIIVTLQPPLVQDSRITGLRPESEAIGLDEIQAGWSFVGNYLFTDNTLDTLPPEAQALTRQTFTQVRDAIENMGHHLSAQTLRELLDEPVASEMEEAVYPSPSAWARRSIRDRIAEVAINSYWAYDAEEPVLVQVMFTSETSVHLHMPGNNTWRHSLPTDVFLNNSTPLDFERTFDVENRVLREGDGFVFAAAEPRLFFFVASNPDVARYTVRANFDMGATSPRLLQNATRRYHAPPALDLPRTNRTAPVTQPSPAPSQVQSKTAWERLTLDDE